MLSSEKGVSEWYKNPTGLGNKKTRHCKKGFLRAELGKKTKKEWDKNPMGLGENTQGIARKASSVPSSEKKK